MLERTDRVRPIAPAPQAEAQGANARSAPSPSGAAAEPEMQDETPLSRLIDARLGEVSNLRVRVMQAQAAALAAQRAYSPEATDAAARRWQA